MKKLAVGLIVVIGLWILFYYQAGINFSFKSVRNPKLTRAQKQWKIYHRNVDTDNPEYPLEVIEDGFKMIRAYKQEGRKYKGSEIPAVNLVEWGWKFTVKNKSKKDLYVDVTYKLKDKDGFEVTSSFVGYATGTWVKAGDIEILKGTSTMNYNGAKRIVGSSWNISYREPEKKKTTLEKLFH